MNLLYKKSDPGNSIVRVARFFDDNFFLTKSGQLGAALSVRGMDPSNVTAEMLQAYSARLSNALRSLPEEFRIYQYLIKRESQPIEAAAEYPSRVVSESVHARNAAVQARGLYTIDLVWVFIYESESLLAGKKKKSIRAGKVYRTLRSNLERDTRVLSQRVEAFIEETKTLLAARLMDHAEVFRFLRRLGNLDDSIASALPWVPEDCIDHFVMDEIPTVHRSGLQVCDQTIQVLSTREPVAETSPNLLKEIFESNCGMILCLEYKRVSIQEANTEAANAEEHFKSAAFLSTFIGVFRLFMAKGDTDKLPPDSAAQKNAKEAGKILERLNDGDALGYFSATIVLHSKDADQVRTATANTIRAFGRANGSLYRETLGAMNAYRSIFPGGLQRNFRSVWMLQRNVADLSLMYAPAQGEKRNTFLNSEYLFVAETNSKTPYFLNLHHGGVCNTFLSGTTNVGKSVFSNMCLDSFQKYGSRVLILDIGGSYQHTCQKHGGSYASLDLSMDKDWAINPFSLPYTEENIQFLEAFIRVLLTTSKYEVTYRDDRPIHEAVQELYQEREGKRQLRNLRLPGELREALYIWTGNGPYASVFDNAEDSITLANFQVFDLTRLENHPLVLEPLFFYIFRRQQAVVEDPNLRETFKLLWADEAWRFLKNETCRQQFVSAGKTYRKYNAGMGLVTQSPSDLAKAGLLEVVSEVCLTKIFLSNPAANFKAYQETFGLNDAEVNNWKMLAPRQQFLLKKAEEPGVVLNLNLSPAELAMYGNSPFENARRDAAIEKYGWEEGMRQLAAAV